MLKLTGIIPALVTPFDSEGNVNYDELAKIIESQLKAGVNGFVPLGSTGENYALNNDERKQVLKTIKEVVNGRVQIIAGVNGFATRDVIEQVKQVVNSGINNLLIAPPSYSIPSQEELIFHYQSILDACPEINIVIYNYPVRTNIEIGFSILDAFRNNPQIIAIKESSGNLLRAIEIGKNYKDDIQLSCGSDDQFFDFFLWGATSWISAPANCFLNDAINFYKLFSNGDIKESQKIMSKLFPIMNYLESGKFIQKIKYGCELAGFNVGKARAPLLPLNDSEKSEFKKLFEASQN